MIVDFDKRLVFLSVPRTGSSSLGRALEQCLTSRRWAIVNDPDGDLRTSETRVATFSKADQVFLNHDGPEALARLSKHARPSTIRAAMKQSGIDADKFTWLRMDRSGPERVISLYCRHSRQLRNAAKMLGGGSLPVQFVSLVPRSMRSSVARSALERWILRDTTHWTSALSHDYSSAPEVVLRYEEMEDTVLTLAKVFGLDARDLGAAVSRFRLNRHERPAWLRPASKFLTLEAQRRIREVMR